MKLYRTIDGGYQINKPRPFKGQKVDLDDFEIAKLFAMDMVFGRGFHRPNRSGGSHSRRQFELFINTLQGKLAEIIVHRELSVVDNLIVHEPDLGVYGKGKWDSVDLKVNESILSIKSMAHFSSLLLLEAKDYNSTGKYIHHSDGGFDFIVVVRFKPDLKIFLKTKKQELITYPENFIENLEYDIPGVASSRTIQHIIDKGYFLPKGSKLGKSTYMDASNWYIQLGSLRSWSELLKILIG